MTEIQIISEKVNRNGKSKKSKYSQLTIDVFIGTVKITNIKSSKEFSINLTEGSIKLLFFLSHD